MHNKKHFREHVPTFGWQFFEGRGRTEWRNATTTMFSEFRSKKLCALASKKTLWLWNMLKQQELIMKDCISFCEKLTLLWCKRRVSGRSWWNANLTSRGNRCWKKSLQQNYSTITSGAPSLYAGQSPAGWHYMFRILDPYIPLFATVPGRGAVPKLYFL